MGPKVNVKNPKWLAVPWQTLTEEKQKLFFEKVENDCRAAKNPELLYNLYRPIADMDVKEKEHDLDNLIFPEYLAETIYYGQKSGFRLLESEMVSLLQHFMTMPLIWSWDLVDGLLKWSIDPKSGQLPMNQKHWTMWQKLMHVMTNSYNTCSDPNVKGRGALYLTTFTQMACWPKHEKGVTFESFQIRFPLNKVECDKAARVIEEKQKQLTFDKLKGKKDCLMHCLFYNKEVDEVERLFLKMDDLSERTKRYEKRSATDPPLGEATHETSSNEEDAPDSLAEYGGDSSSGKSEKSVKAGTSSSTPRSKRRKRRSRRGPEQRDFLSQSGSQASESDRDKASAKRGLDTDEEDKSKPAKKSRSTRSTAESVTFKLAGGDKSDPVTVDTDSDIGEIKKTPTKLEKSEDDVPSTHGDDDTHLSEEAKTAMALEVTKGDPKKTPKAKRKTITPDDPVETFETMQAAYEHCQQVVESLKTKVESQERLLAENADLEKIKRKISGRTAWIEGVIRESDKLINETLPKYLTELEEVQEKKLAKVRQVIKNLDIATQNIDTASTLHHDRVKAFLAGVELSTGEKTKYLNKYNEICANVLSKGIDMASKVESACTSIVDCMKGLSENCANVMFENLTTQKRIVEKFEKMCRELDIEMKIEEFSNWNKMLNMGKQAFCEKFCQGSSKELTATLAELTTHQEYMKALTAKVTKEDFKLLVEKAIDVPTPPYLETSAEPLVETEEQRKEREERKKREAEEKEEREKTKEEEDRKRKEEDRKKKEEEDRKKKEEEDRKKQAEPKTTKAESTEAEPKEPDQTTKETESTEVDPKPKDESSDESDEDEEEGAKSKKDKKKKGKTLSDYPQLKIEMEKAFPQKCLVPEPPLWLNVTHRNSQTNEQLNQRRLSPEAMKILKKKVSQTGKINVYKAKSDLTLVSWKPEPHYLREIAKYVPSGWLCPDKKTCEEEKPFKSLSLLMKHFQESSAHLPSKDGKPEVCKYCCTVYPSGPNDTKSMKDCMKSHLPFTDGKMIHCILCLENVTEDSTSAPRMFDSWERLSDHMKQHEEISSRISCPVCDESTGSAATARSCQMSCLEAKTPFRCSTCKRDFNSYTAKIKHFIRNHPHDLVRCRIHMVGEEHTKSRTEAEPVKKMEIEIQGLSLSKSNPKAVNWIWECSVCKKGVYIKGDANVRKVVLAHFSSKHGETQREEFENKHFSQKEMDPKTPDDHFDSKM